MYILLKIEGGCGGQRKGRISGENNKVRLPEMKRCLEFWARKWRSSLYFVALIISEHGCQASLVWSCWKPNHKSQNTSAHSKNHQEHLVCIPSGPDEEWRWERGKEDERLDGGKPVSVNDVLYSLTACPQQSDWQRKTPQWESTSVKKWHWDETDDSKHTNMHILQNIICLVFTDTLELEYFGDLTESFNVRWPWKDISVSACQTHISTSSDLAKHLSKTNVCLLQLH